MTFTWQKGRNFFVSQKNPKTKNVLWLLKQTSATQWCLAGGVSDSYKTKTRLRWPLFVPQCWLVIKYEIPIFSISCAAVWGFNNFVCFGCLPSFIAFLFVAVQGQLCTGKIQTCLFWIWIFQSALSFCLKQAKMKNASFLAFFWHLWISKVHNYHFLVRQASRNGNYKVIKDGNFPF